MERKTNSIQVIARAASILRLLGREGGGHSLGQIARHVDLPRSTVQRIVSALAIEGFVSVDEGGRGIRLGPELRVLSRASEQDTKDIIRPLMRDIARRTGETVDLARLDGERMLFVDQIEGAQRLRTVSRVGESFPLTTTANGKAALACLDEAEAARRVIHEMERSPKPHRSLPAVLSEIEAVRAGALASDTDEHTDGVSALGFAVLDRRGAIHAVSIPVPSARFDRLRPALSRALEEMRAVLANRLGI